MLVNVENTQPVWRMLSRRDPEASSDDIYKVLGCREYRSTSRDTLSCPRLDVRSEKTSQRQCRSVVITGHKHCEAVAGAGLATQAAYAPPGCLVVGLDRRSHTFGPGTALVRVDPGVAAEPSVGVIRPVFRSLSGGAKGRGAPQRLG
eukprot:67501-Chlamydomonas_euryale.AAC.3